MQIYGVRNFSDATTKVASDADGGHQHHDLYNQDVLMLCKKKRKIVR